VKFVATLTDDGRGRLLLPLPFDPDEQWTPKPRHHISGDMAGRRFRGTIEKLDGGWTLRLSGYWTTECGVRAGDQLEVELTPEGPQRADLAQDLADALAANAAAGAFFDGLAQFYRKGYLRWIDGTKRSPAERARRIAQTVELLAAGVKDYRQR
jgi:hypothetical protein